MDKIDELITSGEKFLNSSLSDRLCFALNPKDLQDVILPLLKAEKQKEQREKGKAIKDDGLEPYTCSFVVDGRYEPTVYATSLEDAVEKANSMWYDANFGELECVDSHIQHIVDKDGNYLDPPQIGYKEER